MCSNHVDVSRQAQTVPNRRQRVRIEHIVVALLTPILAMSAAAESKRDALSLSPLAVPVSPRPVSSKFAPPAKKSLQDLSYTSYPRTHYQRALYLRQKGELDAALIELLKATQINPRLVRAFYEQALIFRERHYLKLAESALQQALAVKPDYQPARILLATVRLEQGNLIGAVNELSRSLGLAQTKTTQPPIVPEQPQSKPDSVISPSAPPRPPSLMQTPHYLLPEPTAPPPAPPSFDPAPAQFEKAPAEPVGARSLPDKKSTSTPEPFILEGTPAGPAIAPANSGASTASSAGQHDSNSWQRALPGGSGNRPATPPPGRLPFTGNLPGFDFRFRNPFNFFRRDPSQTARPQRQPDLKPAPLVPVPGASQATREFPPSKPSVSPHPAPPVQQPEAPQTAREFPPAEPAQLPQGSLPDPSAQSLKPPQAVNSPLPQSPPQSAQPLQARQPATTPQLPPATISKPAAPKPETQNASGWLERVLAGVKEFSGAVLAPPSATKASSGDYRRRRQQAPLPARVPAVPADDSFPMVVVPGKTRAGSNRQRDESFEPIAMVIRQPPAYAESSPKAARFSQQATEMPPQPVPVARALSRPALPSPRGPSEKPPQSTLPAAPLSPAQSTPRPAMEKAPLPDRPVVANLPFTLLTPSPATRQQAPAPALPAAPNRVAQSLAQPSTMPRSTGNPTPVARPPAPKVSEQGLLPAWLSPAPLSFGGSAQAPTPRQIDREPAQQQPILPNRIQAPRDPFRPVRAVGRATNVNPLALLFGSEPGPRPKPPQHVEARKAPQPASATLPAQVVAPPLVHQQATPGAPPPPQPGEPPKLVQHRAQPSALPKTTAVPTPLPGVPQRVVKQPVQPSTISRLAVTAPPPPSQTVRAEKQPSLPQTVISPAPLTFAGIHPAPSPTPPEQRQSIDQSVKPSRMDAPRTAFVPVAAVGRPAAPETQPASVPPADPFMPEPTPPPPELTSLRIAPPAVQRASAPSQQPAPPKPPSPTRTALAAPAGASAFAYTQLPGSQSRLLAMADSTRLPAAYLSSPDSAKPAPPSPPTPVRTIPLDPVAKRMKYLSEHGTASLKEGEAFMFSEETGEAVIFQSNGPTLRRKIAEPKDGQEVVKHRRPDLAFPQELRYNLSLLAKLLPHQEEPKPKTPAQAPVPTFTINELMTRPEGMFGWLRQLFRL